MPALPTEMSALLALVFVLGLRHGIDADHVATIDALTRLQAGRGRRSARWCGALFALGHGGAVMLMVLAAALAGQRWRVPEWVAPLGAWVSIGLLTVLGLANLRAALAPTPGRAAAPLAFRGRLLLRFVSRHPAAAPALTGTLFAASFDTVGQAALLAISGMAAGGLPQALLLGAAFAAGMLVTDGANGWWLARLISRADAFAATASRLTTLAVALVSLGVAGLSAARFVWPAAEVWADAAALWTGAGVLLATLLACAAARWWAQPARRQHLTASETNALS